MPYKQPDPSKHTKARIQRTEAYAEKVRRIYAATVNEILKLNLHRPDLDNDVMYSFDNDTKKVQREVELLLRRLHSAVNAAIVNGIELEWGLANKDCDAMVRSIFGQKLIRSGKLAKYMHRNGEAMQAFINRMDSGMNLSDRVWRDSRHLRNELEAALTVAMGEGLDAGSLSRRVRQYLNDPDLMMRRFSYKERKPIVDEQGNITGYTKGEWKRKWKKRIADPDKPGRYKWIDVDRDNYIPKGAGGNSRGVYKSAAKNSMRLARTETNMAYRNADHERWQQMDFVLGQRVILSLQHPAEDICDLLSAPNKKNYGVDDTRGVYPKEFRFEGWHPQCFCFVSPILADEQAMEKSLEATLRGEEYEFEGQIEDYNDDFKEFVRANADKIAESRVRGTEPYFVRNNARVIDGMVYSKNRDNVLVINKQTEHVALPTKSMYGSTVLEPLSEHQKVNKVQEMTGVTTEKAKEYVDAVESFSHGWDREIREYQNTGTVKSLKQGHTLKDVADKERIIEEFISKSPQWSAPSYRGIGVSEQEYTAILKAAQDGTLDMRGMASWTSELKDAQRYAYDQRWDKECLVVFENAGDARATSIRHLSLHPDENEVLHSDGNRYRIIGEPIEETIYGRHKVIRIRLEAIQDPMTNLSGTKGTSAKGSSRTETRRVLNEVIDDDYVGRTKLSKEQDDNLQIVADKLKINKTSISPMTFKEADDGKANIYRDKTENENNCTSCVLVSEMRRRGCDVTALGEVSEIADDITKCWITKNGNKPNFEIKPERLTSTSEKGLYQMLDRLVNVNGGRYVLGWSGKGKFRGHVLCVERINGELCFYDPQEVRTSSFWNFSEIYELMNKNAGLELLRVDNLLIDLDYVTQMAVSL